MPFESPPPDLARNEMRLHLGGLAEGTRVLTARGPTRVEGLRAGDRLVTRDSGIQVLRLVAERLVPHGEIVRIDPAAFAHALAEEPLELAPTQRLLVRDWRALAMFGKPRALVAARRLVDGELIRKVPLGEHRLYSLHFGRLHVLYANGFEAGSATAVSRLLGG